jgi:tol-pal system protein YbgF
MKSMLAFAAGVLVGVLVTLGVNRFLHSAQTFSGTGALSVVVSVAEDVTGRISSRLDSLLEPAPSIFRYRVSRRLRMARTGVVLSHHILRDDPAPATAVPPVAGERTLRSAEPDLPSAMAEGPEEVRDTGRTEAWSVVPQAPEAGARQRYSLALEAHMAGRQEEARRLFSSFLLDFPSHDLAPNALYWSGETWYSQARYDLAAEFFLRVLNEHPRHAKSPDALLKLAYSAMRQGRSDQARAYLDQLLKRYPDSGASRLGRQARGRLEGRSGQNTMVVRRG